jgi:hypothetical protein
VGKVKVEGIPHFATPKRQQTAPSHHYVSFHLISMGPLTPSRFIPRHFILANRKAWLNNLSLEGEHLAVCSSRYSDPVTSSESSSTKRPSDVERSHVTARSSRTPQRLSLSNESLASFFCQSTQDLKGPSPLLRAVPSHLLFASIRE